MRRWRYLLLAFAGLGGCQTLSNQSGFPPLNHPKKLADPVAVARCLPPLIYLDTVVTPPSGALPFRVDRRLADMRAQVQKEGTITDSTGKVIYVKPQSFPSNAPGVEGLKLVMAEDQRFLVAIMTQAELGGSTERDIKFATEMKLGE